MKFLGGKKPDRQDVADLHVAAAHADRAGQYYRRQGNGRAVGYAREVAKECRAAAVQAAAVVQADAKAGREALQKLVAEARKSCGCQDCK